MPSLTGITNTIGPQLVKADNLSRRLNTLVYVDSPFDNVAGVINAAKDAADFLTDLEDFLGDLIDSIQSLDDSGFWYGDVDLTNLYNLIKTEIQISQVKINTGIIQAQLDLSAFIDVGLGLDIDRIKVNLRTAEQAIKAEVIQRTTQAEVTVQQARNVILDAISASAATTRDVFGGVVRSIEDRMETWPQRLAEELWELDRGKFFELK